MIFRSENRGWNRDSIQPGAPWGTHAGALRRGCTPHRHGVRATPSARLTARPVCPVSERKENARRFEDLSPTNGKHQHEEHRQMPDPRGPNAHQRQPDSAGPKALHQSDALDRGAAERPCQPWRAPTRHRHLPPPSVGMRDATTRDVLGSLSPMLSCLTLARPAPPWMHCLRLHMHTQRPTSHALQRYSSGSRRRQRWEARPVRMSRKGQVEFGVGVE